MSNFVGCDLGGTNIKAGLVDVSKGDVLHSKSAPTLAHEGHDDVMERMAHLIQKVIEESNIERSAIKGVGISAPGVLDLEKGTTVFLPNLYGQWRNVPLKDTINGYLDLPVSILNDVRAITLGEYTFGAGRGVNNMACFAIGTGHITIDFNGPRCGCGNYGCVEAFASAPAIAAMGVKAVQQGLITSIGELADYDLNKITPKLIAKAANHGDEIANEIWEDAGHYIGTAVANAIVTFGPHRVVISGGVAAAGELLMDPIRSTVKKRVFVVPVDEVEVVVGELGSEAGIMGMAQWSSLQQGKI